MITGILKDIIDRQDKERYGEKQMQKRFKITFNGVSGTINEWCNHLGISKYEWYKKRKEGCGYDEMIEYFQTEADERRERYRIKWEKNVRKAQQCSN